MCTKNRISVVIPTYNASPFIRETLDSVFAQTRLPDEVVVVDDCSLDDTVALVEQLAETAPILVRVIRLTKNSGGPAAPLNAGIAAATSEFIATLDQDDLASPTGLNNLLKCFIACDTVGLAFGDVRPVTDDPIVRQHVRAVAADIKQLVIPTEIKDCFVIPKKDAYGALARHRCIAHTCSNFLFRKTTWSQIGGFDEKIRTTCDYRFLQQVAEAFDLGYCAQHVCDWVISGKSLFRSSSRPAINRDLFRVYSSFRTAQLSPDDCRLLRAYCRDCSLGLAYDSRQSGSIGAAALDYWRSIRWSGLTAEAVFGLMKLPLFWLLKATNAQV